MSIRCYINAWGIKGSKQLPVVKDQLKKNADREFVLNASNLMDGQVLFDELDTLAGYHFPGMMQKQGSMFPRNN
jgi:hypothetical protein